MVQLEKRKREQCHLETDELARFSEDGKSSQQHGSYGYVGHDIYKSYFDGGMLDGYFTGNPSLVSITEMYGKFHSIAKLGF